MATFEDIETSAKSSHVNFADSGGQPEAEGVGDSVGFIPTAPHRSEVIEYSPNRDRPRRENSAVERVREQRARRAKKYAEFAKTMDAKLLVGAKPEEDRTPIIQRILAFLRNLARKPARKRTEIRDADRQNRRGSRGRRPAGQNRGGEGRNRNRATGQRRNRTGGRDNSQKRRSENEQSANSAFAGDRPKRNRRRNRKRKSTVNRETAAPETPQPPNRNDGRTGSADSPNQPAPKRRRRRRRRPAERSERPPNGGNSSDSS
jgi:hypothetical protein